MGSDATVKNALSLLTITFTTNLVYEFEFSYMHYITVMSGKSYAVVKCESIMSDLLENSYQDKCGQCCPYDLSVLRIESRGLPFPVADASINRPTDGFQTTMIESNRRFG